MSAVEMGLLLALVLFALLGTGLWVALSLLAVGLSRCRSSSCCSRPWSS